MWAILSIPLLFGSLFSAGLLVYAFFWHPINIKSYDILQLLFLLYC